MEVRTNWGIRGVIDPAKAGAGKFRGSPEGLMDIFNFGDKWDSERGVLKHSTQRERHRERSNSANRLTSCNSPVFGVLTQGYRLPDVPRPWATP